VSITTKKAAYAPSNKNTEQIGSIVDFEKVGARSPAGIRPGVWHVDDPIGTTWGYTSDMRVSGPGPIIAKLADTVSKNGNFTLNISPRADGTIPQAQQDTLLGIGRWLDRNGEAIYGTHNWTQFSDGSAKDGRLNVRFTVKGDNLYAILLGAWSAPEAVIKALGTTAGTIESVTLLGSDESLKFRQSADGLTVELPAAAPGPYGSVLRIAGLKTNPPTATESGNP